MLTTSRSRLAALAVAAGFLISPLMVVPAQADTAPVTRANNSFVVVDGGSSDVGITYTAADFPANSVVDDVNLTVQFAKTDNNVRECTNSGGSTFNNEIYYRLRSPSGQVSHVIPVGTYTGMEFGGTVTVNLDDSASTVVGGGTPASGTFRPRAPLSTFNGTNPVGTWTLTVGDSFNLDTLCHYRAELSITATPIDDTAPTITPAVTGTSGNEGWYTSDASLDWAVSDPETPVSSTTGCQSVTVSADQGPTDYTCTAQSGGGTATETVSIKRDATAPTATFDAADLQGGASYVWGSTPAAPGCTATDDLSGPAGCTVTGYSTAVGTHTLRATATDVAGNTATATRTYTVTPWRTVGFNRPIDMGGVLNTVKGGSTVPVKFELFAGDTEITDTTKVAFSATKVGCGTGTVEDAVEVTSTGGTVLRYDSTTGQFLYNWSTPRAAGSCIALTMTSADSSTTRALFKIK